MKITKQKPVESKKNQTPTNQSVDYGVIEAIKAACRKPKGRVDIKFLYSDGKNPTVHRFRVNWWQEFSSNNNTFGTEQRIAHSEFIKVIQGEIIKVVRENEKV